MLAATAQAASVPLDRKAAPAEAAPSTYLGVVATPLTDAQKEKMKVETGVYVSQVLPGSPAAKADLQEGDVITAVGNTSITSPRQLAEVVHQYKNGEKVKVVWFRDGKRVQETATIMAAPADVMSDVKPTDGKATTSAKAAEPVKPTPTGTAGGEAYLGVVAGPMTGDMMDIAGTDRGVIIKGLTEGSPASKGGLQAGDVITSVDGADVNDPKTLIDIVRTRKAGDTLRVTYYRMGKRREAAVVLGERPAPAGRPGGTLTIPGPGPGAGMELPQDMSPEMRKYLESMRPQIDEWMKQFEEQGGAMPRSGRPGSPSAAAPPPYDAGKDIGRILERLDQLNKRLDDIEKRLDQVEKKK
jgi:membrane-associated protease RseP (regulator of RpoE activity)